MEIAVVAVQSMEIAVSTGQEIPIATVAGHSITFEGYGPRPGSSKTRSSKTP